nr:hypothetical protein [Tanacetum cinerariifolium]
MQANERYKFSDGTLKTVHDELHHKILNFHLGYNNEMSRRKWMAIDKKRSEHMVELIDKQIRERRIIRNLERLIGARELEMDYKLMTRTISLTKAGNLVKKILLKLNLFDHRSILTDLQGFAAALAVLNTRESQSRQRRKQDFAWRSWMELLVCQKSSKLKTSTLEVVLKKKHQNLVFSSCFGHCLLEEIEEDLDHHGVSYEM